MATDMVLFMRGTLFCGGGAVGNLFNVVHFLEDAVSAAEEFAGGVFRVACQWAGQRGCYECCLAWGETVGGGVEVELCHRFHTVDAVAHFYGVEVHFHNALFAPDIFYQEGEVGF